MKILRFRSIDNDQVEFPAETRMFIEKIEEMFIFNQKKILKTNERIPLETSSKIYSNIREYF